MNILPLVYLGNIQYYTKLCFSECVIDVHEHFVKQSYRSRCDILGGNGPMALTVPTVKMDNERKCTVKETRIDYSKRWQHQHWHSIRSAYYGSPYFDFYREELEPFYEKRYEFLLDFNLELTALMLRWLGCRREPVLSEKYVPQEVERENETGMLAERRQAGCGCAAPDEETMFPAGENRLAGVSIDAPAGSSVGTSAGTLAGNSAGAAPCEEEERGRAAGARITDYRNTLSPKPRLWRPDPGFVPRSYYQVFSDRMAFVPNLSVIDLLFCEGPGALEVLRGSVCPDYLR